MADEEWSVKPMTLPQLLVRIKQLGAIMEQAWEQGLPEFSALEARYIRLYEQALGLGWQDGEPLPQARFACIKGSGRCSLAQAAVTDCIYTQETCPWVEIKEKE